MRVANFTLWLKNLYMSVIAFGLLIMNFEFAPLGRQLDLGRLFFGQFLT